MSGQDDDSPEATAIDDPLSDEYEEGGVAGASKMKHRGRVKGSKHLLYLPARDDDFKEPGQFGLRQKKFATFDAAKEEMDAVFGGAYSKAEEYVGKSYKIQAGDHKDDVGDLKRWTYSCKERPNECESESESDEDAEDGEDEEEEEEGAPKRCSRRGPACPFKVRIQEILTKNGL